MQLPQSDAAATNQYRLRVMCLVAGNRAEQAIVDERLERPAAGLRGKHRLQADTGTPGRTRAFLDLQLHGLGSLLLQLLQLCLMLAVADHAQRLLQWQALACRLGRACAKQNGEAAKGKRAHGHGDSSLGYGSLGYSGLSGPPIWL
ncbi:hypothetical protein D9M71_480400 [compost metagenome]